MAWNPSPKVQIARKVAEQLGENGGDPVDRIVILYTTRSGKISTISYGQTISLCRQTRTLADLLYDKAFRWFSMDDSE